MPEIIVFEQNCDRLQRRRHAQAETALGSRDRRRRRTARAARPDLPVLRLVEPRVLIAVDHDNHGKGEAAAREAEQRWLFEDRELRLAMRARLGDWNDVLRGKHHA